VYRIESRTDTSADDFKKNREAMTAVID